MLADVEAGVEGEGVGSRKMPPFSFTTDGLSVRVDLLEEGALACDGVAVERFATCLESLPKLRAGGTDSFGVAGRCRSAEASMSGRTLVISSDASSGSTMRRGSA